VGLFSGRYDKPGPGISKNAPKKKSFFLFWEIYGRKFWKLIIANLVYVLLSIPVVTCGLADVGLTYVTRNFARETHAFVPSDMFDMIRKKWKKALPMGILGMVVLAVCFFDIFFFWQNSTGWLGMIGLSASFLIFIIVDFMSYYIYMMMITFDFSFKQLLKNSFAFAMVGIKRNMLIGIILLLMYVAGFLILFIPVAGPVLLVLIYLFLFPAFRSLLIQFTIFPVVKKHIIDPYYKEHPGEDIDKMRSLNLDPNDIPKPEGEEEDTEDSPDLLENEDAAEEEDDDAPIFQDRGREVPDKKDKKAPAEDNWTFPTPHRPFEDDDDTI
jgi:uncharacterized membrane protein YesL